MAPLVHVAIVIMTFTSPPSQAWLKGIGYFGHPLVLGGELYIS